MELDKRLVDAFLAGFQVDHSHHAQDPSMVAYWVPDTDRVDNCPN